jgi:SpoVK/Ycf46/Vps4 family AAA+-type ATPase
VSKYIGDTEKNLDGIFASAAERDCVLFFDEADAIFGKRGEQRDSHDKYANMQTSYLLQRFEEHDGIVILATNYAGNMDAAFIRRIQNIVEFSKPNAEQQQRIWKSLLLPTAPWGEVDVIYLSRFDLTGSEIKNIVLHAAFLAAARNGDIGMNEIVFALNQELHKIGRPKAAKTFGEYARLFDDGDLTLSTGSVELP